MKNWAVRYRRTCEGTADVEAETAEAAKAAVEGGNFDFDPGEEMVDWGSEGTAVEQK